MSSSSSISELDVIGFIGRFSPEDWPVRLLPVYRSRTQQLALLPPFREHAGQVQGVEIAALDLEERIDEGEITVFDSYWAAKDDHLLWLSQSGPRYMPRSETEQVLDTLCLDTVQSALRAELSKRRARVHLFRSLRARPTGVANALLSVHFQLSNELSLVKPIREDLTQLSNVRPLQLEADMIQLVAASNPSRQVITAVAAELRRAGRQELAKTLLQGATEQDERAAWPTPPMRWADIVECTV
ncbi:hypothetical protein WME94_45800 [Sorangium sp. So ce429]